METKKCPKCGTEIPVEMSFCLHCMERTDGVLEIRKKAVPSRKYIIAVIIAFAIMTAVIVLFVISLNRKEDHGSPYSSASFNVTETTADITENDSANETYVSVASDETTTEQITQNNTIPVNFEEIFTQRLNSWGASHVLTDTLSFSENGCAFTSNVGTDKVNCTVTANSDMTDFTLTIEPATEYTSYSMSVYIPDIVNEITYFVLDYRMSSSLRTDIGLMFENFESEGSFAENELNCNISTQAHNNGSYPVTVNCFLN